MLMEKPDKQANYVLTCSSLKHPDSFMLITLFVFSSVFLQFIRHQRQNLPIWMRLTMALFGFLFPREALIPRLRGEQRWRDLLAPASVLVFPAQGQGTRLERHCKVEHGFGFCFLIEYEDEMKKTLVTAGRRLNIVFFCLFAFVCSFLLLLLLCFFASPRRSHCVWRDIFEIFVRLPILYSKLLFLFGN